MFFFKLEGFNFEGLSVKLINFLNRQNKNNYLNIYKVIIFKIYYT